MIRNGARRTLDVLLYLRFIAAALFVFALGSAGCSGTTYVTVDGAVADATPAPDGTLTLLSPSSIAIRPGETSPIEVQCTTASGAPCAFVDVTFAIEGAGLDSTLSVLSMQADADGRATGGVIAGTEATSFRVRVLSRTAARPVYVDVGVGTSFGTLIVRAPYRGARIVTRRIVDVVPRARCEDLTRAPPEVGARALPADDDEVSIAGLPTTVRYAVLARAESDVALTASGCVDDVELTVDATTRVDVPYADAALVIDGRYEARLALDATSPTDAAAQQVTRTFDTATVARGGDAASMLDALETALSAHVSPSAAAAFGEARTLESLERTLGDRLTEDRSAPAALATRWVDAAGAAMAHPRIEGTLVVATAGATVVTERLIVSDAADGEVGIVPATLDPGMGVPRSIALMPDGTRDSVRVASLRLDAPLGAMLLAWLDAVAASDGLAGAGDLFAPACGTLAAFVAGVPAASGCDAACVETACEAITAAAMLDLAAAAAALDVTAGALTVSGSLAATDADGDVRVDTLSGPLTGSYDDGAGLTLGTVSGTIEIARATPTP